tara:strand:- start:311 stop:688 length:378 start_codon:yes stop_codon:yes gene_type:complete
MTYTEKYHKINLAMSVERTYTSFMRNCIVLFTLGLTIINLTKRRKTEKYMLSFIIIISGIVMGIISTKEFYDRVKLIEDGNYRDYKLLTKTIGIYGFIIFIFIVVLIYKFVNINDEHNIIKFKKK